MSYFVYANDKPRKYKGYTITPNKRNGTWKATKKGRIPFERTTLTDIVKKIKLRKR